MKYGSQLLSLLLCAGIMGLIFAPQKPRQDVFTGTVSWVSDGDTFRMNGYDWPIRIWGVDAPEMDERGGQAARDFLSRLILNQQVSCSSVAVDRYRRTVGKCTIGSADISRMLLENGHGVEMCRFTGGALGSCT